MIVQLFSNLRNHPTFHSGEGWSTKFRWRECFVGLSILSTVVILSITNSEERWYDSVLFHISAKMWGKNFAFRDSSNMMKFSPNFYSIRKQFYMPNHIKAVLNILPLQSSPSSKYCERCRTWNCFMTVRVLINEPSHLFLSFYTVQLCMVLLI